MKVRIALYGEHGTSIKAKCYVGGNKEATIYATEAVFAALRAKLEAPGGDTFVIDDVRGAIAPVPKL